MDRLSEIQLKLRDVGCPICYHTEFRVTLETDETDAKPVYRARCGNCGHVLEVGEQEPEWEHLEAHVLSHIRREGCPRCKSHRLALNFRCTLTSRECFHVATCENCGASFVVEKYARGERPSVLDR